MRLILSPTILEQVTNLRLSDHTKLQREAPTAYLSYTKLPAALNWFVKNILLSFEPLRYVSKKLNAPYRSGPSRTWIKVTNPNAPAPTRAIDGTFWGLRGQDGSARPLDLSIR